MTVLMARVLMAIIGFVSVILWIFSDSIQTKASVASAPAEVKEPDQFMISRRVSSLVTVVIDTTNGCQYLNYGSSGLTPRLNPNGTQVCKVIK